ncbi:Crp/Fnr family transcriptional regulator [Pelagerythrobacter aerophilus]|uniref:Crp/Fnr family transcriptional regulator n=1 Tax=Pelagerythrobacter aerophilus TaxID=2306995 RepID=A0A418NCL9_9SPHN|nr:Crp/Fnr family transcriptional regulator [Pelagerythrobacter aerophilus]RIV75468.1 Crp/Fnr family transcriptional regulator [Pelagerythrobacter aerophilus]
MLSRSYAISQPEQAAVRHLGALARLTETDLRKIADAASETRYFPARTEIVREGAEPAKPTLLLRGWVAHQRILPDGRRQIVGFTLAGELFGRSLSCQDRALTSQVALDNVVLCTAPEAEPGSSLSLAYEKERLAHRLQLIDNVTRLGRMDARERVCDLLLELLERLQRSGEAEGNTFAMPLTQECFADALGLTPVHLNRTLQACRKSGDLSWRSGRVTLHDPAGLARSLGRRRNRLQREDGG